eukprot:307345_1
MNGWCCVRFPSNIITALYPFHHIVNGHGHSILTDFFKQPHAIREEYIINNELGYIKHSESGHQYKLLTGNKYFSKSKQIAPTTFIDRIQHIIPKLDTISQRLVQIICMQSGENYNDIISHNEISVIRHKYYTKNCSNKNYDNIKDYNYGLLQFDEYRNVNQHTKISAKSQSSNGFATIYLLSNKLGMQLFNRKSEYLLFGYLRKCSVPQALPSKDLILLIESFFLFEDDRYYTYCQNAVICIGSQGSKILHNKIPSALYRIKYKTRFGTHFTMTSYKICVGKEIPYISFGYKNNMTKLPELEILDDLILMRKNENKKHGFLTIKLLNGTIKNIPYCSNIPM